MTKRGSMIKRLKEKIKELYFNEQFNPSLLGLFINPFYFARRELYKNISELMQLLSGRVLDIGCGQKPYAHLCKCLEYIGLELDTPYNRISKKADYFYDGKTIPFTDEYFDCIISIEVFEHVFNPYEFLHEINRVTKLGGYLLISVPFVWDEHEQPNDFGRYTSFGMKYLLNKFGFDILEYRKVNNGIEAIFQLLNVYIYKVVAVHIRNRYIKLMTVLLLTFPFNLVGLILSKILPKNNDFYLDNLILARKVKHV